MLWLGGGALLAAALASFLLPLEHWTQAFQAWIEGLGAWGFMTFTLAYVLAAVLLLPSWPLSITGGLAFGIWGFIWVPLAATLAASASFLIGRYVARSKVQAWLAKRPQYSAVDRAIGEEGWKVVALLRLSPLVPFNLMNYFCGLTEVSFLPYVAATFLGILPGTTLYVYLGFVGQAVAAGDTLGWVQWTLFGVGLIATLGVAVLIARRVKVKLQHAGLGEERADAPESTAGEMQAAYRSGAAGTPLSLGTHTGKLQ